MFATLAAYLYIVKHHHNKVFPGRTDAEGMGLTAAGMMESVIYLTIIGHFIGWW